MCASTVLAATALFSPCHRRSHRLRKGCTQKACVGLTACQLESEYTDQECFEGRKSRKGSVQTGATRGIRLGVSGNSNLIAPSRRETKKSVRASSNEV